MTIEAGCKGKRRANGILLGCALVFAVAGGAGARAQSASEGLAAGSSATPALQPAAPAIPDSLEQLEGLTVRSVAFEGVAASRLVPLPDRLAQAAGAPLSKEKLKLSLRQLYASGLYETVEAEGWREGGGMALVFRGKPSAFIGTIGIEGAKGATLNAQLERATQLTSGVRLTPARLDRAVAQMRETLALNGFRQPQIDYVLTPRPEEQLVDIDFHVADGPQARVGAVAVEGDSGMSAEEFRRHARLRAGSRVDRDTANRALSGVLRQYRGQDRLEAEIKLQSQQYLPGSAHIDYRFSANRGPIVKVEVDGARMSPARMERVIPIFEEGAVDDDLLNEGNHRLRDYYQRLGYFDVKVDHLREPTQGERVEIRYTVRLGPKRRVEQVSVTGNRYFDAATLKELLAVHAADSIDRHGAYSQTLVAADIANLQALYRNNGFADVKIVSETGSGDGAAGESDAAAPRAKSTVAPLTVLYRIAEGPQQRVETVRLEGVVHGDPGKLLSLLNTAGGQLLSPQNLAEDRDTLLTDFLSRGFDQARVEVVQTPSTTDPNRVNVAFRVHEGRQIFVRKVLLTGIHYTRPETVTRAIVLHPGDPLNQTALLETQRNLYDLALFNKIDMSIENPSGAETEKTVLLQAEEARRWVLTYGGGFEAQTGTPQNNCVYAIAGGAPCNPNGKVGVSVRVLADITRNNLFGREQSASLQGTYGLLEQKIDLLFQNPHFLGAKDFGFTLTGGYANSQDVTTYVASKLEGGVRWTERFNAPGSRISKANTFVYEFNFRRVKVAASSLQVYSQEIAELSTAVRVAGPSITWIRDTRDSPLDARRGTYTTFQEFLSDKAFGAEAEFNRIDLSNSSYYSFSKGRFVLARNTRYGQERAFGSGSALLIPLPERLYAGGATSLRGYSINAAGPRDPETGYPIGGAGVLVNSTELRLPPPTLPWFGNAVSFVLFHDMGNVFTNAGDAWVSALRLHQPDRANCQPGPSTSVSNFTPSGPNTSTGWQSSCGFNYFSHAPGLGMRYHTPVGPIRLDFSYNLNPPIYPAVEDYTNPNLAPHTGEAGHFNYFFSLGQTF